MERLGDDGNDMRRKGHAATGNGIEKIRCDTNEMIWNRGAWCRLRRSGFAPQRTDTRGDEKELRRRAAKRS